MGDAKDIEALEALEELGKPRMRIVVYVEMNRAGDLAIDIVRRALDPDVFEVRQLWKAVGK